MGRSDETAGSFAPREARDGSGQKQRWEQLTLQYLRDLPRQLDVVIQLLVTKDYGAIKEHAHRMKGTSGTYQLNSIAEQFARLERLAGDQNDRRIAALVDAIALQVKRKAQAVDSPAAHHGTGNVGEKDG